MFGAISGLTQVSGVYENEIALEAEAHRHGFICWLERICPVSVFAEAPDISTIAGIFITMNGNVRDCRFSFLEQL